MEVQIAPQWRKSSHSGNGGGDCVEVTGTVNEILVRDTKDRQGKTLTFTVEAWQAFAASLK